MFQFSHFPTLYWATNFASQTAIVWKRGNSDIFSHLPEQISWQQWHIMLCQTVKLFQQQGISNSQLVAYQGSNRLIGLLCYSAVIAMGGKILMLNSALKSKQCHDLCEEYEVAILLTDQFFIEFANFSVNSTACELPDIDFSAPATLTLTSGSSGKPKAIVHSIQNHLANAESVCELVQFERSNSWLLSLPLFHVSGQGIVWRWLLMGATLWINEDKVEFFELLAQVSHCSLVPTQLQRYLNAERHSSENSVQKFLLGGTVIPAELIKQAKNRNIVTFSGYGMTEMASTICAAQDEIDCVGKPLKGREVKIVEGEIWVKGSSLALGYWQKNGEILPLVNQVGWLQTKDRGHWNERGQLVIEGRFDNMFISGGENIQPEEVEKILYQSGLVKQIFVLPKSDVEFGQRPIAVVEFLESFTLQAVEKLQYFANQHLEKFKQPVAYLPLEAEKFQHGSIKISRKQLIDSLPQLLEL